MLSIRHHLCHFSYENIPLILRKIIYTVSPHISFLDALYLTNIVYREYSSLQSTTFQFLCFNITVCTLYPLFEVYIRQWHSKIWSSPFFFMACQLRCSSTASYLMGWLIIKCFFGLQLKWTFGGNFMLSKS